MRIQLRQPRQFPVVDGSNNTGGGRRHFMALHRFRRIAQATLRHALDSGFGEAPIAGADGVLLVTPEYNGSLPGVFKNAVDWTTRPGSDIARVWGGRPVAVIGASPGGFGTVLSQQAWLPVFRKIGALQWHGATLMVSRAGSVFDAEGRMTDEKVRGQLRDYLQAFAAFAASRRD